MAKRRTKRKYIDAINPPHQEIYWLEILGIFLFAVGVFLLISFIFEGVENPVSMFLEKNFSYVFGWAHYIVPLFFIIVGIQLVYPQHLFVFWTTFIMLIVIIVDFSLLFHLSAGHGGKIGQKLSSELVKTTGKFGGYTVFALVFLAAILVLGRFSLKDIIKSVACFIKEITSRAAQIKLPSIKLPQMPKKNQLEICSQEQFKEDVDEESEVFEVPPNALAPNALAPSAGAQAGVSGPAAAVESKTAQSAPRPDSPAAEELIDEPKNQIELFPGVIKSIKEKVGGAFSAVEKPSFRRIKYKLPGTNLLTGIKKDNKNKVVNDYSQLLTDTLMSFGVEAKVIHIERGPTVTRYELQPARGVKVSRITNLSNDIALVLAAQSIRIEAPIPGKSAIGIEIPNKSIDPVHIKEILESRQFKKDREVPLALGKDITGYPIVDSLIKMPHLLIAGATGSGKTVCINTVITSILFKYDPGQVQFLMIDPKRVELIMYEGIPHLVENDFSEGQRIVTDPKKATLALKQLTVEMDKRYKRFAEVRARNIYEYNKHCGEKGIDNMPYLILVIDELADLMMLSAAAVETSICRLAQLGRASGIHLILATQRPSVDVITGLIKANIPSRIAFAVSSQIDSRTIIDRQGAEKLLGRGDMLYMPIDEADPRRIQGAYIDQEELERVVDFWSNQPDPSNMTKLVSIEEKGEDIAVDGNDDAILNDAINIIRSTGQASTSFLQRKLRIGYARASRIMDILEQKGIVGSADGSRPRKILMTIGHSINKEEQ